jgi:hypothetical protein
LGKGKKKQEWEGEIAHSKTTELIFVAGKYSILLSLSISCKACSILAITLLAQISPIKHLKNCSNIPQ